LSGVPATNKILTGKRGGEAVTKGRRGERRKVCTYTARGLGLSPGLVERKGCREKLIVQGREIKKTEGKG